MKRCEGAKQAEGNRYIDLFLHDGPAGDRERFVAGPLWHDDAEGAPDLEKGRQFFRMAKHRTGAENV